MHEKSNPRVLKRKRLTLSFDATANRANFIHSASSNLNVHMTRSKTLPLRKKDAYKAHNIISDLKRKGIIPNNIMKNSTEDFDEQIEEARTELLFSLMDGLIVDSTSMYI